MPKKKQPEGSRHPVNNPNVMGLRAAVVEQPITDTLETNYMPYAMSVIVSRAIPEIEENGLFDEFPEAMTYPHIQPKLMEQVRAWLDEGNFHSEEEDIFELLV